ncbi:MAG: hypothetical protein Q9160_002647 [Pyrenula sp. 1 TL-2023]
MALQVFEKSRFKGEVGSGVLITPNGERVLSRLGFDFGKAKADEVSYFEAIDGISLASLNKHGLCDPREEFGAPLYTIHRVDMLNELLSLAEGLDVRLGTRVAEADAEEGFVVLEDGTRQYADLIVAADGVHSILRAEVLRNQEGAQDAAPSGLSTYRFIIPTSSLQENPEFHKLQPLRGNSCCLFADTTRETERHMVFAGIHESDLTNESDEDLKSLMLEEFGHYHPSLIQLFNEAPLVTDWRLDVHEPLPTWHRGKVVLIGDAAHPMLPLGAQGANQAIEDAGALGALLGGVGGTGVSVSAADVPRYLALFERARRLRASRVQLLSKVRIGKETDVEAELRKYADPPGSDVPLSFSERYKHDYGFNVYNKCREVLVAENGGMDPGNFAEVH